MGSKLLGMGFLESLNCLVVGLKLGELLLVLLDTAVESCLELLHLPTEVGNFALVVGLKGLLLGQEALFVLHKLVLALLLLIDVLLLKSPYLLLPSFALLGFGERLFLPTDDAVGTIEKSFNFFLVGVLNSDLHRAVFFVLAVQVEDHLRQLGDLLRHLVVCLLVHLSFSICKVSA